MHAPQIDKAKLSRRLNLALIIPIAILLVLGFLLAQQVASLSESSAWVAHSDGVIGRIYDTQKQVSEQESAVRGFLLSRDPVFLTTYRNAHPAEVLDEITTLTSDHPLQTKRFTEARDKYDSWREEMEKAINAPDPKAGSLVNALMLRRTMREDLQNALNAALDDEIRLRAARVKEAENDSKASRLIIATTLIGLSLTLAFFTRRQLASVAQEFADALGKENKVRQLLEDQEWVRTGQVTLSEQLQGDLPIDEIAKRSLNTLASYCNAAVGAFFAADEGLWRRKAVYALDEQSGTLASFALGEGLVGKTALGKGLLHMRDVPPGYLRIRSGVGQIDSAEVIIIPCWTELSPYGAIELGFLHRSHARLPDLLGRVGEIVATAVRSAEYKARLRRLLEQSQRQSEELHTQQEELRVSNEELQQQSHSLRQAKAQLEERKEALESTNAALIRQRTDLQAAEQKLTDKAAELERASQYKSEFLANMSHELRTPLNSTLILSKLLSENKDKNLSAEQVKYADTIYSAGNDLLALINDVLDLSKIEAGMMDIHRTLLPVDRLVDPIHRSFEQLVKAKRLAFDLQIDKDVPEEINIDIQRAQQVLKNLLSNALKFTKQGSISLRVSFKGGVWHFAVRDTGIGIPQEQQDIIFEAFRQADGTTNRQYGGTGLGLSISRDLARLMGGVLSVDSTPGKGATFTLSVPHNPADKKRVDDVARPFNEAPPRIHQVEAEMPPERQRMLHQARDCNHFFEHRHILVAEDDIRNVFALTSMLEPKGAKITITRNGREAIEALEALEDIDLILMDIMMPEMDGLQAMREIRKQKKWQQLPIIALTAKAMKSDQERCINAGANDYIAKPLDIDTLLSLIRVWLPKAAG